MKNIAVIGGGSWGTALALVLAAKQEKVNLWVRDSQLAGRMRENRVNDSYLPSFVVPPNVQITANLEQCCQGVDGLLIAVPSHAVRSISAQLLPFVIPGLPLISATKGLEEDSLLRMSEVIAGVLHPVSPRLCILSGPTFATEVAARKPAALVAASSDPAVCRSVQAALSSSVFRVYRSQDPIGVELGGAMKNVVAIAAGLCDGLALGANARAAVITRGLAEMSRLSLAMGALPQTLSGLAGLGDLVLTCTGDLSRNRRVGYELALGRTVWEVTQSMAGVAEGVRTTHSVVELGRRHHIDLPIAIQMDEVLHSRRSPAEAILPLMERSLKEE